MTTSHAVGIIRGMHKTILNSWHADHHAKLVDFAGWHMPLNYGSQIDEHHAVRQQAGIFDVSHMGVVDIKGEKATAFLRYLLANDAAKLQDGKAFYSCMLNEAGKVKDDLIVYRIHAAHYRIVVNASMRERDVTWMQQQAKSYAVDVALHPEFSIIAVQGPKALMLCETVFGNHVAAALNALNPFSFMQSDYSMIARTGYTGEQGVEIIVPNEKASALWQAFIDAGAKACGLGARDTLRLEAGFNLYGHDMDETTSPLIANLSWTISFKDNARDFIGRAALEKEKQAGVKQQLVGLVLNDKGVLRDQQNVYCNGAVVGNITSGGFSPTLKQAIAFARLPINIQGELTVERRDKHLAVTIVKLPFVRDGKSTLTTTLNNTN